jgi:hypothetical protein
VAEVSMDTMIPLGLRTRIISTIKVFQSRIYISARIYVNEGTYTRDEKPGVDDIECIVGVRDTFDSIALFELCVGRDFGPSSPIGSEVDTETRDLWEFSSHFDDPAR